eukprot:g78275.t1
MTWHRYQKVHIKNTPHNHINRLNVAGQAEESERVVDTTTHALNAAFGKPSAWQSDTDASNSNDQVSQESSDKKQENLLLQGQPLHTDLKIALPVKENHDHIRFRCGIEDEFFVLDVGSKYRDVTAIKTHTGCTLRRKYDHPQEGSKLVDGEADGDRILLLVASFLNGEKIEKGTWIWFISAAVRSESNSETVKHTNSTFWLARVLAIIMNLVQEADGRRRPYVHFILCYRSKHGNIRVISTTPQWIHAVVTLKFQAILNLDEAAASLFSESNGSTAKMLTTAMAKLMKRSAERVHPKGESGASKREVIQVADASARTDTMLQQLVAVKVEFPALQEGWKNEVMEMQHLVNDTLKLHEDERKGKVLAERQLKEAEARGIASLRDELAEKRKVYNSERSRARFQNGRDSMRQERDHFERERNEALEQASKNSAAREELQELQGEFKELQANFDIEHAKAVEWEAKAQELEGRYVKAKKEADKANEQKVQQWRQRSHHLRVGSRLLLPRHLIRRLVDLTKGRRWKLQMIVTAPVVKAIVIIIIARSKLHLNMAVNIATTMAITNIYHDSGPAATVTASFLKPVHGESLVCVNMFGDQLTREKLFHLASRLGWSTEDSRKMFDQFEQELAFWHLIMTMRQTETFHEVLVKALVLALVMEDYGIQFLEDHASSAEGSERIDRLLTTGESLKNRPTFSKLISALKSEVRLYMSCLPAPPQPNLPRRFSGTKPRTFVLPAGSTNYYGLMAQTALNNRSPDCRPRFYKQCFTMTYQHMDFLNIFGQAAAFLTANNDYARKLCKARDLAKPNAEEEITLTLLSHVEGETKDPIAPLIDGAVDGNNPAKVVTVSKGGERNIINHVRPEFEALAFPWLFWTGSDSCFSFAKESDEEKAHHSLMRYCQQRLLCDPLLQQCGC